MSGRGQPLLQVLVGTACRNAGDALRAVDQSGVVGGDFVLVSGDTVCNLALGAIVAEHQARRQADSNAIMTMVRSGCAPFHSACLQMTGTVAWHAGKHVG